VRSLGSRVVVVVVEWGLERMFSLASFGKVRLKFRRLNGDVLLFLVPVGVSLEK